jgi:hypothetical protein
MAVSNGSFEERYTGRVVVGECADQLATRGIFHRPTPQDSTQTVTEVSEDTNVDGYEIRDGEETLDVLWKQDCPQPRTYLWMNAVISRFTLRVLMRSIGVASDMQRNILRHRYSLLGDLWSMT